MCCSLQATAPVKLQVEEALNKGVGSFQELLQQQKETLRSLQQDYSSYAEQASVHPSVVVAQRESAARRSGSKRVFLLLCTDCLLEWARYVTPTLSRRWVSYVYLEWAALRNTHPSR